MRLKKPLLAFHRWFGLLLGGWLLLVSTSGAFLVFHEEIDRALNPNLHLVEPGAVMLPLDRIASAVAVRHPGNFASYFELSQHADSSVRVYLRPQLGSKTPVADGTHMFFNPYTGQILGERVFGMLVLDRQHLVQLVYQFHMDFLLGPWMTSLFGLLGLGWLMSQLAGLVLATPRGRALHASLQVRWSANTKILVYDLHRAGGIWMLPVTFMLAMTGIVFDWQGTRALLSSVSQLMSDPIDERPLLKTPVITPVISLQSSLSIAGAVAGHASIDAVSILPERGVYWVQLYDRRDVGERGQRSVLIDMRDGAVLMNRHERDGSWADEFLAWQLPAHSGYALGTTGRGLVFLAGIAVSGLSATGILMWWRRGRTGRR